MVHREDGVKRCDIGSLSLKILYVLFVLYVIMWSILHSSSQSMVYIYIKKKSLRIIVESIGYQSFNIELQFPTRGPRTGIGSWTILYRTAKKKNVFHILLTIAVDFIVLRYARDRSPHPPSKWKICLA